MSAFLDSVTTWLVDYFVAATLLLAIAAGLRTLLHQPAARMAVAWSTCLGLLAMALLSAWPEWPRVQVTELAQMLAVGDAGELSMQPEAALPPEEQTIEVDPLIAFEPPSDDVAFAPLLAEPPIAAVQAVAWDHLLLTAWMIFAACVIGWMLLGWSRARGLVATAIKAPAWVHDELRRIAGSRWMPRLLTSPRVNSAVALGTLSPKIVLPQANVAQSNAPAVRAALAHEWAHIRHGDLWLLALERLLLPLLAVHPLFWWLRRSVRLDQELLADAAAAGEEPAEYAEALLVWARTAQPARHGMAALSMWEHPNTLSRRVAMILDPKRRVSRPLSRGWTAVAVALAIPAILALSVLSLRPSTAQEKPPEAQAEAAIPLTELATDTPPPLPQSAGQNVPITQVHMELLVLSVYRDKLAAADTTLEEAIAQATDSRCRKEAGLVVSEIKPEEVVKLLEGLKKRDAIKVISRPSVITLDGREASVHVGGEVPILRVEETTNGKHEQRVEFKEFGTMLMVRPKLSGEKGDLVTLDIVAEQSNLVPPGEKAVEGAVPRNVPGLVSHKFKLTSDVKLGDSLLVAESPADKKQLRDAVNEQFLLIVRPQRAVRTVAAVYADPREGDKGEAARAATEAALNAATAAEPEPDTAAAVLLKAEREATALLKRQVEALQREVERLQAATGTKLVSRTYKLRLRKADDVAADLTDLLRDQLANADLKLSVDATKNSVMIQVTEKHADEVGRVISVLDRTPTPIEPNNPNDAYAQLIQRTLADRRRAREPVAAQGPQPPTQKTQPESQQSQPPAQKTQPESQQSQPPTQKTQPPQRRQPNWGLLTADVAEARLDLDRAEKEFARVEQLKARGAISEAQVEQKQYELERAKIELQRAEAHLFAPVLATEPPAPANRSKLSEQTETRLLELDLADARLALDEAESELARVQQIQKQSPSAISEQEIRKHQFQAERAKIQMQRIMIKLEAAKGESERPK